MIELGIASLTAAPVLIAGVILIDRRQRKREARRRGDIAFMARALEVAQRGGRRRPKADARIQRRRFGPG